MLLSCYPNNDLESVHWQKLASAFPQPHDGIRQIVLDPNATYAISLPTTTPEWSPLQIRRLGNGAQGRVLQVLSDASAKLIE
jgi:hypothetical protein